MILSASLLVESTRLISTAPAPYRRQGTQPPAGRSRPAVTMNQLSAASVLAFANSAAVLRETSQRPIGILEREITPAVVSRQQGRDCSKVKLRFGALCVFFARGASVKIARNGVVQCLCKYLQEGLQN